MTNLYLIKVWMKKIDFDMKILRYYRFAGKTVAITLNVFDLIIFSLFLHACNWSLKNETHKIDRNFRLFWQ